MEKGTNLDNILDMLDKVRFLVSEAKIHPKFFVCVSDCVCVCSCLLDLVVQVLPELSCPVSLFTYYNPILKRGLGKFMSSIRDVGVQGLVVPDVPLEETELLREGALSNGIELVINHML